MSSPYASNVPAGQSGKYNVALILSGAKDDKGWSQAHYLGAVYLKANTPDVNVYWIENVSEFSNTRPLFRELARKGYQLIIGTAFGYSESMASVAKDFPDVLFVQVLGQRSNGKNLVTLHPATEEMEYLVGMLAGARAQANENPRLGFIATFPVPEQFRLINAAARGMKESCPGCTLEVRWISSWNDEELEAAAARQFIRAGIRIVLSGAISPNLFSKSFEDSLSDGEKDYWVLPFGLSDNCADKARCLTSAYWIWGAIYEDIIEKDRSNKLTDFEVYAKADVGGLGLYGFMTGEKLSEGLEDIPIETQNSVKSLLERMQAGDEEALNKVFAAPIIDQSGKTILEDKYLEWSDLDQFPPGEPDNRCKVCMFWFSDGIISDLPSMPEIGR